MYINNTYVVSVISLWLTYKELLSKEQTSCALSSDAEVMQDKHSHNNQGRKQQPVQDGNML